MATINNAIQEMVDHLVDKMRSNEKLSAEEQTLVSNAIQKLSSSANLEAAIVAVAQEHLGEATGHLTSASDVVKELQAKLLEQSDNLGLLPELETKFNEITSSLVTNVANTLADLPKQLIDPTFKLGEPEFRLDYYDNTVSTLINTTQVYGAYNSVSLANYDNKTFYGYFDAGSATQADNPAVILMIDSKGEVSKATRTTPLIAPNGSDTVGVLVLPSGENTLFSYIASTKQLTIYKSQSFTTQATLETDYFKLYQDKETKNLYSVDAGILHEFDGSTWIQQLQQTFSNETQFDSWALAQGLEPLHNRTIKPVNSSIGISSQTGYLSSLSYLSVTRPPSRLEAAFKDNTYETMTNIGTQRLVQYNQSTLSHATNRYIYAKSFKSRVKLPNLGSPIRANLESVAPTNSYESNSANYHAQGYPQLITYSPIHNALIVYQYFRFFENSNNHQTQSLCRVYFA
ncbi:hypothetical protein [Pseudoalteromonas sp. S16_S37]|uniref:hypothetical protein n=1 Tax=Pseudoalteromonas sp. S16_S37 TaxID=2720228 RepID=UPI00168181D7|nr:hypothetical protein [Pseudoalteromonas sp. S16_S37]MBD1581279.1 hypothetical protein [Pseudoalteromonas sp. S16_S37]